MPYNAVPPCSEFGVGWHSGSVAAGGSVSLSGTPNLEKRHFAGYFYSIRQGRFNDCFQQIRSLSLPEAADSGRRVLRSSIASRA